MGSLVSGPARVRASYEQSSAWSRDGRQPSHAVVCICQHDLLKTLVFEREGAWPSACLMKSMMHETHAINQSVLRSINISTH